MQWQFDHSYFSCSGKHRNQCPEGPNYEHIRRKCGAAITGQYKCTLAGNRVCAHDSQDRWHCFHPIKSVGFIVKQGIDLPSLVFFMSSLGCGSQTWFTPVLGALVLPQNTL